MAKDALRVWGVVAQDGSGGKRASTSVTEREPGDHTFQDLIWSATA